MRYFIWSCLSPVSWFSPCSSTCNTYTKLTICFTIRTIYTVRTKPSHQHHLVPSIQQKLIEMDLHLSLSLASTVNPAKHLFYHLYISLSSRFCFFFLQLFIQLWFSLLYFDFWYCRHFKLILTRIFFIISLFQFPLAYYYPWRSPNSSVHPQFKSIAVILIFLLNLTSILVHHIAVCTYHFTAGSLSYWHVRDGARTLRKIQPVKRSPRCSWNMQGKYSLIFKFPKEIPSTVLRNIYCLLHVKHYLHPVSTFTLFWYTCLPTFVLLSYSDITSPNNFTFI